VVKIIFYVIIWLYRFTMFYVVVYATGGAFYRRVLPCYRRGACSLFIPDYNNL
jgi:hypothetical protein